MQKHEWSSFSILAIVDSRCPACKWRMLQIYKWHLHLRKAALYLQQKCK